MNNNLREEIERICLQDITAINNIISTLSKKIQDRGTGHINTAISVLEQLIEEMEVMVQIMVLTQVVVEVAE